MASDENSKLVVITGTTRGLGRAMTAEFVARGHVVAGCGRSPDGVDALGSQFPPPHRFSVVDVSDGAQVKRWAQTVLDEMGTPDLLINNAALINRTAPLWEITEEEFRGVMSVNVGGVANMVRYFTPAMVKRRSGVIVNFSSAWGRSVSAEMAPYCASKWAIEGLTRALAAELPRGMAAVSVNPGMINTKMLEISFGSGAQSYPDPAKWAQTAVPYLLSVDWEQSGDQLSVPV